MELIANGIKETLSNIDKKFGESISKMVDNICNEVLRSFLPNSIEDKVIEIKDKLGLNQLGKKVANFTKNIINNKGKENINLKDLSIEKEIKNLISVVEKSCNLNVDQVSKLEKNKKNISNEVEEKINNKIKNYVNVFEESNKYIDEWKDFYKKKDFKGMENVYKKIEKNMKNIIPIEEKIKEIRELENIHLLVKRKGGDFNLTNEELELTKKLV